MNNLYSSDAAANRSMRRSKHAALTSSPLPAAMRSASKQHTLQQLNRSMVLDTSDVDGADRSGGDGIDLDVTVGAASPAGVKPASSIAAADIHRSDLSVASGVAGGGVLSGVVPPPRIRSNLGVTHLGIGLTASTKLPSATLVKLPALTSTGEETVLPVRDHGMWTRSFRVGWGPNGTLVHTTGKTSIVMKRVVVNQHFTVAPSVEAGADSSVAAQTITAAAATTASAHAAHIAHVEAVLQVHLDHYSITSNRHRTGSAGAAVAAVASPMGDSMMDGGGGSAVGEEERFPVPVKAGSSASSLSPLATLCNSYVAAIDRVSQNIPLAAAGKNVMHAQLHHARTVWQQIASLWSRERGAAPLPAPASLQSAPAPARATNGKGLAPPVESLSASSLLAAGAGAAGTGGATAPSTALTALAPAQSTFTSEARSIGTRRAAYAESYARYASSSDWLMDTIKPEVEATRRHNASQSGKGAGIVSSNDAHHIVAVLDILTLVSANQIEAACEVAYSIGDMRLAIILSQAGGGGGGGGAGAGVMPSENPKSGSSLLAADMSAQIEIWMDSGLWDKIDPVHKAVYRLLSGDTRVTPYDSHSPACNSPATLFADMPCVFVVVAIGCVILVFTCGLVPLKIIRCRTFLQLMTKLSRRELLYPPSHPMQ